MNEIAVGAAGLALILGGAGLAVALSNRRRMSVIPRDGNLIETLRRLDEDLANVETAVARLQPVVKSLGERMPGALRYASVVTFDANEDRTGHLSRSIALLNERRDGLVITLLHGPRQTLFFTKMITDGTGVEPLSPEEQAAVDRALGR
ncbi:MAG: hypothetical protein A2Z12_00475 [Actinobacteria bacterium RBG_16_68_21]|nr:MAG: hypothetical protein A2Z12_00475 [Actinobacteria bacterium RBG_16_68_21]